MEQEYLTIHNGEKPVRPSIPKNPDDFIYTQDIEDMIVRNEGFHKGWIDVEGKGLKTTGYGFLDSDGSLQKKYPNGMTKAQALYYLKNVEFPRRVAILKKDTPNWDYLNNNQRTALFDLHYNIGEGAYRRSKNLKRGLENMDWNLVAKNMDHGMNMTRFPGLRKRRLAEQKLFLTPMEEAAVKASEEAADLKVPVRNLFISPTMPVPTTEPTRRVSTDVAPPVQVDRVPTIEDRRRAIENHFKSQAKANLLSSLISSSRGNGSWSENFLENYLAGVNPILGLLNRGNRRG